MIYLFFASSSPTGLGGGRRLMIVRALDKLADYGIDIQDVSSFYRVEPEPKLHAHQFACLVAEVASDKEPIDLLQDCKLIEFQLGRARNRPGTPRSIDIDLLAYHDVTDERLGITVPHENLSKHLSYLVPLNEVNPDWVHPESGQNIKKLLKDCSSRQQIKKIENIDHTKTASFWPKNKKV